MRILVFTGGLGNQMFEYSFYCHLKSCFPKGKFYGYYGKKLTEHYGLEINKWFDVELPPEKWWTLPVAGLFYLYKQLVPHSKWLDLNQQEWLHRDAKLFFPFKFSKRYFPKGNDWLKWKVEEASLSDRNKQMLQFIRNHRTCFVHVRRGDYLNSNYKRIFEGCCTLDYYKRAIAYIKGENPDMKYICFSDDLEWMCKNLPLGENATYVNWNVGENSPLDMYLMSQCENGIIANSSFSYWGAYIGKKKEIVIYPQKWWNNEDGNPDLFMNEWVAM
ncbi:MAG: alpha-1,2-fucosyltransferase [Prevotella sp.]|jgi:hypothetical protein|nr:alpha-1,2-fucosyltransferase [Prevotella sp.]